MAKLIGHFFSSDTGKFVTFEVDGLKETEKQFTKTTETNKNTVPNGAHDYWSIMRKNQLGTINENSTFYNDRTFTMYDTAENMPQFKKTVVDMLRNRTATAKTAYEKALSALESAEGALSDKGDV